MSKVTTISQRTLTVISMMMYPDKSKPFHLFTDSSNFTWSSVLMQTNNVPQMETPSVPFKRKEGNIDTGKHDECKGKDRPPFYTFFENETLKAIAYHSVSFQGSQLNWSALGRKQQLFSKRF